MIDNHNGIADLDIYEDGNSVAVVYRTVNDTIIVARATSIGTAFAAMANEIMGFPVRMEFPDELGLPSDPAEYPGVSIERLEGHERPELDFEDGARPPGWKDE